MSEKIHWTPQTIAIDQLINWSGNPRKISYADLQILKSRFEQYGSARTLTVTPLGDKFEVIGGNQSMVALRELGHKEVHCSVSSRPMTEHEKQQLSVYLNHTTKGEGEWDYEILAAWDQDELIEWGVEMPEIDEKPKVSEDDFYQFLLAFYTEFSKHLKEGGAVYVWHASSEIINFAKAYVDSGLLLKQQLIWVKSSLVIGRQDYQWKHEPCLYGWKPGAAHYFTSDRTNTTVHEDVVDYTKMKKDDLLKIVLEIMSEKTPSTVINCDKPTKSELHLTMKPILLLAPQIENSSLPGQIVADGFAGSGSTMVACHQMNRISYNVELSPQNCQIMIDRMKKLDETLPVKINGTPHN